MPKHVQGDKEEGRTYVSFPRPECLRRGRSYKHFRSMHGPAPKPRVVPDGQDDDHDPGVYRRANPDLHAWAGFGLNRNLEALEPEFQPEILGTYACEGQRKAMEAIHIHLQGAITTPFRGYQIPPCWMGEGLIPPSPMPVAQHTPHPTPHARTGK